MTRPTWQETFFDRLEVTARRSTCPRLHTAACLVDANNREIASGYNGSIMGQPHCTDEGCLMIENHCLRTIHAETNAIINAARTGVSTVGTIMYCLHEPCMNCAKYIVQAGIVGVYIGRNYENKAVIDFLKEANITTGWMDRRHADIR